MDDAVYRCVPKDVRANLLWRREVVRWGNEGQRQADELVEMCRRDVRFFANAFCWLHEPRPSLGQPSSLPFVTYPYQDEALLEVDACLGNEDLVIEKSRDMGVSWLVLVAMVRRWLFEFEQAFGLTSRTEDYVDNGSDPKSLFFKVRFLVDRLPMWMLPGRGRDVAKKHMTLANLENGSIFVGEAPTGNMFRGGRLTALLADELAAFDRNMGFAVMGSTRDVTPSRIFPSTLARQSGAFEQLALGTRIRKLTLPWWRHPEKARGLYRKPNGKLASAWYDREVGRCVSPAEAARELDIDHQAATSSYFDPMRLASLSQYSRRALRTGVLQVNGDTGEVLQWRDDAHGGARLWSSFDMNGCWPRDRDYVMGVDVSSGIGSTNSVIQVVDCSTGEQVAEFCDSKVLPHQLAALACGWGEWFTGRSGPALCVFENAGPGQVFCSAMWGLGYRRFYMRKREDEMGVPSTTKLGLSMNGQSKEWMLGLFRQMVYSGGLTVRSRECIDEMRCFEYTKTGTVEHSGARTDDNGAARSNHGDRASALALCAVGMGGSGLRAGSPIIEERPLGAFGMRLKARQRAMATSRELEGW